MSPSAGEVRVVLVTGPGDELRELGRRVVEARLAACVNVVPGVWSVYRWEGAVEEAREDLAVLKTTDDRVEELEARVLQLHPYDEPEFVVLPVAGGSRSYLGWIRSAVSA